MVKRIFVYIIFTVLCQTVMSASFKFTYKDVTFNCKIINDSTVEITSWNRGAKTVVVPSHVTDKHKRVYNVSTIDVYSSGDNYLTEGLVIEDGITDIDTRCFHEFRNLNDSIILPKTLINIGKSSFDKVKNYKIMQIPTEDVRALLVNSGIEPRLLPPVIHREELAPTPILIPTSILVVKAVSLNPLGIIGVRSDQKKDYGDFPCALIKVSLASKDASYSGDIPEMDGYIQKNIEGYDKIWMLDEAKNLRIYSENNTFESSTIQFNNVNPDITELKGGMAYELILSLEKKQ